MTSCAWLWICAGALLMLLELMTPGFILCFFGLAAASVGVLRFLFGESFDITWQLASFSVLSILYIVLLRRWFQRALTGRTADDRDLGSEYAGRVGRVTVAIAPPLAGRILVGDSEWTAESDVPLAAGVDVRIVAQHNLTMKVEAI